MYMHEKFLYNNIQIYLIYKCNAVKISIKSNVQMLKILDTEFLRETRFLKELNASQYVRKSSNAHAFLDSCNNRYLCKG